MHQKSRFSMLHNQSRFLQEAAARPFFLCLAEIARRRPLVVLLENVLGLMRVWDQVEKALLRLRPYGYRFGKVSCQLQQFFAFSPSFQKQNRNMLKGLFWLATCWRVFLVGNNNRWSSTRMILETTASGAGSTLLWSIQKCWGMTLPATVPSRLHCAAL